MAALVLESWSGARGPVEAARAMGVSVKAIQSVIATFKGVGHRLEFLCRKIVQICYLCFDQLWRLR